MVVHANEPSDEPERIIAALERLGRGVRTHRQDVASRVGLSPLQLDLIRTIAEGRPPEPVTGRLATELGVTQPTITEAMSTLERKGYVTRRPDPHDRRRTTIALTLTGELLATDARGHEVVLRNAIERLPLTEQHAALAALLDLIGALLGADIIRVARTCPSCRFFARNADDTPRCSLLRIPLGPANYRVNCAEHQPA